MLEIHTSNIRYNGADRLDITVKSGEKIFAPTWPLVMGFKNGIITWQRYCEEYTDMMHKSYANNTDKWIKYLQKESLTLVCYCVKPYTCHRGILPHVMEQYAIRLGISTTHLGER